MPRKATVKSSGSKPEGLRVAIFDGETIIGVGKLAPHVGKNGGTGFRYAIQNADMGDVGRFHLNVTMMAVGSASKSTRGAFDTARERIASNPAPTAAPATVDKSTLSTLDKYFGS